jgi:uncharacterized protein (DUF2062 family)/SAM-dependent methyltransferase
MPERIENQNGKPSRIGRRLQRLRSFLRGLLTEGLDPRHMFSAVFWGVFIGVVPIYGLQTLTALFVATLFKFNKPLTLGATFINNPLLQPFLIFGSLELGHLMRHGSALHFSSFRLSELDLKSQLADWITGSLALGLLLGFAIASCVVIMYSRSVRRESPQTALPLAVRFVRKLFQSSPPFARGFVRWKLRLDKIFGLLLLEDFSRGPAVDLGCGYGIALAIAAYRNPGLRLIGCDLDRNRIRIASQALSPLNAQLSVQDIRSFVFPEAGLVMIMDVLQYLDRGGQRALLERCCAALQPHGKLIFRVPDKGNGLLSQFTLALDRIIFRYAGKQSRPTVLLSEEYEKILQDAGTLVDKRRLTGRLPLAHVVFTAKKPESSERDY